MKTGRAALMIGAAAGLSLSLAGPAAAQSPGGNGAQTIFDPYATLWYGAGAMHDPINDSEDINCFNNSSHCISVQPDDAATTWSPDGTTLFIQGQQPNNDHGLIRYNVPANTVVVIAAVDTGSRMSVSPDGKQIAVAQGRDVKVLNSTTGALVRNLTPNLAASTETDPSWSPKNTGIAYTASDGIRIRPPAGGASRLWKKGVHEPDYSPDGTKIAYLTSTGTLQYADTATGATVVNTGITVRGDGYATFVQEYTWSPDGKNFLFNGLNGCAVATITGKVTSHPLGAGNACTALSWQPTH